MSNQLQSDQALDFAFLRQSIPKALQKPPKLQYLLGETPQFQAFQFQATSRPSRFTVDNIPVTKFHEYTKRQAHSEQYLSEQQKQIKKCLSDYKKQYPVSLSVLPKTTHDFKILFEKSNLTYAFQHFSQVKHVGRITALGIGCSKNKQPIYLIGTLRGFLIYVYRNNRMLFRQSDYQVVQRVACKNQNYVAMSYQGGASLIHIQENRTFRQISLHLNSQYKTVQLFFLRKTLIAVTERGSVLAADLQQDQQHRINRYFRQYANLGGSVRAFERVMQIYVAFLQPTFVSIYSKQFKFLAKFDYGLTPRGIPCFSGYGFGSRQRIFCAVDNYIQLFDYSDKEITAISYHDFIQKQEIKHIQVQSNNKIVVFFDRNSKTIMTSSFLEGFKFQPRKTDLCPQVRWALNTHLSSRKCSAIYSVHQVIYERQQVQLTDVLIKWLQRGDFHNVFLLMLSVMRGQYQDLYVQPNQLNQLTENIVRILMDKLIILNSGPVLTIRLGWLIEFLLQAKQEPLIWRMVARRLNGQQTSLLWNIMEKHILLGKIRCLQDNKLIMSLFVHFISLGKNVVLKELMKKLHVNQHSHTLIPIIQENHCYELIPALLLFNSQSECDYLTPLLLLTSKWELSGKRKDNLFNTIIQYLNQLQAGQIGNIKLTQETHCKILKQLIITLSNPLILGVLFRHSAQRFLTSLNRLFWRTEFYLENLSIVQTGLSQFRSNSLFLQVGGFLLSMTPYHNQHFSLQMLQYYFGCTKLSLKWPLKINQLTLRLIEKYHTNISQLMLFRLVSLLQSTCKYEPLSLIYFHRKDYYQAILVLLNLNQPKAKVNKLIDRMVTASLQTFSNFDVIIECVKKSATKLKEAKALDIRAGFLRMPLTYQQDLLQIFKGDIQACHHLLKRMEEKKRLNSFRYQMLYLQILYEKQQSQTLKKFIVENDLPLDQTLNQLQRMAHFFTISIMYQKVCDIQSSILNRFKHFDQKYDLHQRPDLLLEDTLAFCLTNCRKENQQSCWITFLSQLGRRRRRIKVKKAIDLWTQKMAFQLARSISAFALGQLGLNQFQKFSDQFWKKLHKQVYMDFQFSMTNSLITKGCIEAKLNLSRQQVFANSEKGFVVSNLKCSMCFAKVNSTAVLYKCNHITHKSCSNSQFCQQCFLLDKNYCLLSSAILRVRGQRRFCPSNLRKGKLLNRQELLRRMNKYDKDREQEAF